MSQNQIKIEAEDVIKGLSSDLGEFHKEMLVKDLVISKLQDVIDKQNKVIEVYKNRYGDSESESEE